MLDIIPLIFNYINDGKTYKSILYSSKLFYDIMLQHYPLNRYILYNKLWNWDFISIHPSLTMDIIKKNLDRPWNWSFISQHQNITMDIIKNNINYPWDWMGVSCNPNLTIEIIIENSDKYWNWHIISFNKNIKMSMLKEVYNKN